ncbi:hypothetical protein MCCC1A01412_28225 [Bacillus anthracis]|uniref:hypothetical protein n=1 Tax=Bacillus anthracis TaxID=1392 RepID=UPI0008FE7909|nr:hypothetical protein [Bacillus anthracis]AXO96256.1 hypothetical protein DY471_28310 [Bacillus anthracis]OJD97281.1 hypothetical protein MCCC1A01412_28225 [Bacillus anthracis]
MSKSEINEKVSIDKALDIAFANSEFLSVIKKNMQRKYVFRTYSLKYNTDKNIGVIEFGVDCNDGNKCLVNPNFSVTIDFSSQSVNEIRKPDISEEITLDLYSDALEIAFDDTNSEFLSVIKGKMTVEDLFKTYDIKHDIDKNVGGIEFGLECKETCLIDPSFSVKVDFVSRNVVEIRDSGGSILFSTDNKLIE